MITLLLFSLLVLLYVVYAIVKQARPVNYPPGPKWWPFLGNGYMLRKLSTKLRGQHLALSELAEHHGSPLLGLRLGGEYVVVGLTLPVVKEILTRDDFNGRPDSFFMKLRCFGKREGVTGSDGPLWQEHRSFVVKRLKVFGFGKTTMEDMITEEVKDLIDMIKKEGNPVRIGQALAPAILSVIWGLVAGKRLQRSDKKLIRLLELLNRRARAFDMAGGYLNQFPWLRHLAPEKTGFKLLTTMNEELKEFLTEVIEDHKRSYSPDVTRDLIDAFLHEQKLKMKYYDCTYTDSQLIVTLLDLFIAGSQTTSSTLDFAFLYMLKNPGVQEKVYDCLRKNVARDELPKISDRQKLSYVEAVIAEVQRLCNVVPVCGPRRCLKDTQLNGYFIPKNATVLISLWSVHKDRNLFPEPENFLPERFMDKDGNFVRNNNLLPFGLGHAGVNFGLYGILSTVAGKRRCLGDILAKSCIFLIFSGLMKEFEIVPSREDPTPTLEPLHGITLAPKRYLADFVERS